MKPPLQDAAAMMYFTPESIVRLISSATDPVCGSGSFLAIALEESGRVQGGTLLSNPPYGAGELKL